MLTSLQSPRMVKRSPVFPFANLPFPQVVLVLYVPLNECRFSWVCVYSSGNSSVFLVWLRFLVEKFIQVPSDDWVLAMMYVGG